MPGAVRAAEVATAVSRQWLRVAALPAYAHQLYVYLAEGMAAAGDGGLGMRLYITKWVTLRFDWRQHFILARRPDGGVLLPSTLMVGLGTMYPYTEDRP